jgi:hypothetical protein
MPMAIAATTADARPLRVRVRRTAHSNATLAPLIVRSPWRRSVDDGGTSCEG